MEALIEAVSALANVGSGWQGATDWIEEVAKCEPSTTPLLKNFALGGTGILGIVAAIFAGLRAWTAYQTQRANKSEEPAA